MQVTLADFPKPAFLMDLASVVSRCGPLTVLVLVETRFEAPTEAIGLWLRVLPECKLLVAAPDTAMALIEKTEHARHGRVTLVTVREWGGAEMREEVTNFFLTLQPSYQLIVTTMPYDPYGTLVKAPIETAVSQLLRRSGAIFLVHDPVFGTLRVLNADLLEDRLLRRPRRVAIYRRVVRVIHLAARIFAALGGGRRRGWRTAT